MVVCGFFSFLGILASAVNGFIQNETKVHVYFSKSELKTVVGDVDSVQLILR